jgi:hypothetical protein
MPSQRKALAWIATAGSRHFDFEGHGATETEALAALDRAFFLHGDQHGLPENWHTPDVVGDVRTRPIYAGASFRDGEELQGDNWQRTDG